MEICDIEKPFKRLSQRHTALQEVSPPYPLWHVRPAGGPNCARQVGSSCARWHNLQGKADSGTGGVMEAVGDVLARKVDGKVPTPCWATCPRDNVGSTEGYRRETMLPLPLCILEGYREKPPKRGGALQVGSCDLLYRPILRAHAKKKTKNLGAATRAAMEAASSASRAGACWGNFSPPPPPPK